MLPILTLPALAHITMSPNYGAGSGGYFFTSMKIPHGEPGMHTTRLVMDVPRGVWALRPEYPPGWNVTVTTYELAEEDRYTSHGRQVTTAPDQIVWQATTPAAALYTDHLMLIGLQLKIGCSFSDPVKADYSGSNSVWQEQRTLWFKIAQHSSHDDTLEISETSLWSGALADDPAVDGSPAWNPPSESGLKACPYIYIHAGDRCSIDHSGAEDEAGGMTWMGAYVPKTAHMGEVQHVQHAMAISNEAALNAVEGLSDVYAGQDEFDYLTRTVDAIRSDKDKDTALAVAVLALVLASLLTGVMIGLCCFRLSAKEQFARTISAVPLMTEHTVKAGSV